MKICRSCILPLSEHVTSSEDENQCYLCNYSTNKADINNNTKDLNEVIEKIKASAKNSNFDCLVGVSGGRDSTFLLYQLVKKHNLRCLAAYHRTPFTPDIIDDNVKRITKTLNVPLIRMDISNDKHKVFTRNMLEIWLKRPNSIIANLCCAPCKKHNFEIFKIARKNKIKYVILGSNQYETFQLGAGQFRQKHSTILNRSKLIESFLQLSLVIKRGLSILTRYPVLFKYLSTIIKSSLVYLNNRTIFLRVLFPQINSVDYFFVAGYNEKEVNELIKEINYKIPENCNSLWRADCSFNEIKNIMFKYSSGINYMDAYLSNMVRSGVLNREEALNRINQESKINKDRLGEVCNILDVPSSTFDKFI